MTRQPKTPTQRAGEALGVATRRRDKAGHTAADLEIALARAREALAAAEVDVTYLAASPHLKTAPKADTAKGNTSTARQATVTKAPAGVTA